MAKNVLMLYLNISIHEVQHSTVVHFTVCFTFFSLPNVVSSIFYLFILFSSMFFFHSCWMLPYDLLVFFCLFECTCPRFSISTRVFQTISNGETIVLKWKKNTICTTTFFISSLRMPDSVNISVPRNGCYCSTLNTAWNSLSLYRKRQFFFLNEFV